MHAAADRSPLAKALGVAKTLLLATVALGGLGLMMPLVGKSMMAECAKFDVGPLPVGAESEA